MFKNLIKLVSENVYLFIGILIGLHLSTFISNSFDVQCDKNVISQWMKNDTVQEINLISNKLQLKVNSPKKIDSKKLSLVRPRYYSTELGIRDKLFVGVFTSEEKVNTQAIHINQTIGHLVNKLKFFITAQYKLKSKFNLTGLVGFTDARFKYRPFQIIKYVGDNFSQNYDYYFFANDYTFIDIHKLKDVISKISVGLDVYMGTKTKDSTFCNLDAGILISNSVLKSIRSRLSWCITNAVSDDHSENIGRCVYHSLALSCQESIQDQSIPSVKIKHFEINKNFLEISKSDTFKNAITVYPVLQKDDFYVLNAYFLKNRLTKLKNVTNELSKTLTDSWPPGQRTGAHPATRYDVPRQYYFNMSHVFLPDDFTNIRQHSESEIKDITNIIEEIKAKELLKPFRNLVYRRLVNGYKTFDLSRGMDYTMDLGFRNLNTGKEVIKRYEICKPLGNVEFIPVPYVTENSRVTIIIPVEEHQTAQVLTFLKTYASSIMERKEKAFLLLALLYQYSSESQGTKDVFAEIKQFALKTSNKYQTEDNKMAWVSIRLPESQKPINVNDNNILNFAVIDLALKKVGLDNLILVLDVNCDFSIEFLNRVRMNTILNFQIFSVIPYQQYNPKVTDHNTFDVNKNSGHFDREEYKYISFYGRDYVEARKKYQNIVPLIRTDSDIVGILKGNSKDNGNIFEMFLKFSDKLHCMRATDMSLKVAFHEDRNSRKTNLFLGNDIHLAKTLLLKEDQIPDLL